MIYPLLRPHKLTWHDLSLSPSLRFLSSAPARWWRLAVQVKWQKRLFEEVEVDTSQPPALFKMQLFSLSGVPPERQKIMIKGGKMLKDDSDWAKLGVKQGQRFMMMGSAGEFQPTHTLASQHSSKHLSPSLPFVPQHQFRQQRRRSSGSKHPQGKGGAESESEPFVATETEWLTFAARLSWILDLDLFGFAFVAVVVPRCFQLP